ncbi:MAG: hypothetical protein NC082_04220 [Clostridiales bacterium]|nr:hypothetical protein [Clostridiales bacterium]
MKNSTKLMIVFTVGAIISVAAFWTIMRFAGERCENIDKFKVSNEVKTIELPSFSGIDLSITRINTNDMVYLGRTKVNIKTDSVIDVPQLIMPVNICDSVSVHEENAYLRVAIKSKYGAYYYEEDYSRDITLLVPDELSRSEIVLNTDSDVKIVIDDMRQNVMDIKTYAISNIIVDNSSIDTLIIRNCESVNLNKSSLKNLHYNATTDAAININNESALSRLMITGGNQDGLNFVIDGAYNEIEVCPCQGDVIKVNHITTYSGNN